MVPIHPVFDANAMWKIVMDELLDDCKKDGKQNWCNHTALLDASLNGKRLCGRVTE